ncbi:MAG: class I SAM-dependent methyltransferase [Trueperaceae bacterium]|nr:class I SAM-dependent methyltransferase [Trueperaceae bacterium]
MIYDDDPELYDLQYESYRDDIPFYLRLAAELGGPVLEIGAGTGRLTEALAAAGHEVVAIDYSEAMLARSEPRLHAYTRSGQVTLLKRDMRELELGREFALVIAPFNTLMHAYTPADQDGTLAAARRHLAAGATFAFDVYQPHLAQLGVLRREPEWSGLAGPGSELFLVQHHDPDAQTVESVYFLDEVRPDGSLRRRSTRLLQRYFTRFELQRALVQAGFANVRLFGGFEKQRLSAASLMIVGLAKSS